MSMELWILVALAAAAVGVGVVRRRYAGDRSRRKETKNVYPLW